MATRTYSAKASDIQRQWHLIDVADKVLGRAASQIATLLKGKPREMKIIDASSAHQIFGRAGRPQLTSKVMSSHWRTKMT